MSDEWIYPWPKPISVYDSDGPREKPLSYEPLDFELFGAKLRIQATRQSGIDSDRIRYQVACLTCDEVLHEATTGSSSRFNGHLEEKHGKPRRRYDTVTVAQTPAAAKTPRPERTRYGLMTSNGDGWSLLLECEKPGATYLKLEIGGCTEARVPIENVLQGHLKVDEGAEAETQRQIKQLRDLAGDWESKYYDKKVDQMRLGQLEGELAAAKKGQAEFAEEVVRLRSAARTSGDSLVAANLTTLLNGARSMLRRCPRCSGNGRCQDVPCPYCGVFRELVAGMSEGHGHAAEIRTAMAGKLPGDTVVLSAEAYRALEGSTRKSETTRNDDADLERGLAQLEGNRQEALIELNRCHVFLLHPGMETGPYWELANERDPEVIRLRAGKVYAGQPSSPYVGKLPPAFMRGRFMALEPAVIGGDVWTEATEFVEVDRERGLAAVPERLRERYSTLAEGRW